MLQPLSCKLFRNTAPIESTHSYETCMAWAAFPASRVPILGSFRIYECRRRPPVRLLTHSSVRSASSGRGRLSGRFSESLRSWCKTRPREDSTCFVEGGVKVSWTCTKWRALTMERWRVKWSWCMETCGCSCTAGCRAWSTAVPSRGRRAQKNVQVSAASGHIPLSSPGYHIYI